MDRDLNEGRGPCSYKGKEYAWWTDRKCQDPEKGVCSECFKNSKMPSGRSRRSNGESSRSGAQMGAGARSQRISGHNRRVKNRGGGGNLDQENSLRFQYFLCHLLLTPLLPPSCLPMYLMRGLEVMTKDLPAL